MFERLQKLRYVLHDKDPCFRPLHNLKERSPELFTRIAFAILIQQTETLARRAADHHVGLGNLGRRVIENIYNVAGKAMSAKIGVIGLNTIMVEIISPHRIKSMTKALGEAQRHTASPGESIEKAKVFAFLGKFAGHPGLVDTLLFPEKPLIIIFVFSGILHLSGFYIIIFLGAALLSFITVTLRSSAPPLARRGAGHTPFTSSVYVFVSQIPR